MTHHSKGLIVENTMQYILKLNYPKIVQIFAIIVYSGFTLDSLSSSGK